MCLPLLGHQCARQTDCVDIHGSTSLFCKQVYHNNGVCVSVDETGAWCTSRNDCCKLLSRPVWSTF